MHVKAMIGALLLAAGLSSAGCGVIEDDTDEPSESTVEDETTVWCSNKAWRVDFYAEPELINVVGWIKCSCYQPQTRSGTTSQYTNLAYEFTCSLD